MIKEEFSMSFIKFNYQVYLYVNGWYRISNKDSLWA